MAFISGKLLALSFILAAVTEISCNHQPDVNITKVMPSDDHSKWFEVGDVELSSDNDEEDMTYGFKSDGTPTTGGVFTSHDANDAYEVKCLNRDRNGHGKNTLKINLTSIHPSKKVAAGTVAKKFEFGDTDEKGDGKMGRFLKNLKKDWNKVVEDVETKFESVSGPSGIPYNVYLEDCSDSDIVFEYPADRDKFMLNNLVISDGFRKISLSSDGPQAVENLILTQSSFSNLTAKNEFTGVVAKNLVLKFDEQFDQFSLHLLNQQLIDLFSADDNMTIKILNAMGSSSGEASENNVLEFVYLKSDKDSVNKLVRTIKMECNKKTHGKIKLRFNKQLHNILKNRDIENDEDNMWLNKECFDLDEHEAKSHNLAAGEKSFIWRSE